MTGPFSAQVRLRYGGEPPFADSAPEDPAPAPVRGRCGYNSGVWHRIRSGIAPAAVVSASLEEGFP